VTGAAGATASSTKRARVVIVNVYEDDNRGGAALTLAAVRVARRLAPDPEIVVVPVRDSGPDSLRHLRAAHDVTVAEPLVVAPTGRLGTATALLASVLVLVGVPTRFGGARPRTLRAIRDADVVLSRGGVIFAQRTTGLGDHARLWLAVLPCVVARRFRRPRCFVGAQIGPVLSRAGSAILRLALGGATFVWVRGPRSYAAARSRLGRHGRVTQGPDSVFLLDPSPPTERGGVVLVVGGDQGLMGPAVPALAEWLSAQREPCTVLQQLHGDRSDARWLERLQEYVPVPAYTVVDDDLDVGAYMQALAGAELVVSTRMHSVLLALLVGTPAVAVLIDDDYRKMDVLEGLGVEDLAARPSALGDAIAHARALGTASIERRARRWRDDAEAVVAHMQEALGPL
jgi:polysaccharide pyruvyl transferase WcaK-like protein